MKRYVKIVKKNCKNLEDKLITVYRDIELSESERKFLSLGSTFPLIEDLEEAVVKKYRRDSDHG